MDTEIKRLEAALDRAIECLTEYALDDRAATFGCYKDPEKKVGEWIYEIKNIRNGKNYE